MKDYPIKTQIFEIIRKSLKAMAIDLPNRDVEEVALLIDEATSFEVRYFHRARFAAELIELRGHEADDPIFTLASLFRDVVKHEIDGGFSPAVNRVLAPLVDVVDGRVFLTERCMKYRTDLTMLCELFDFSRGQSFTQAAGRDEFLSSLVAYEALRHFMPSKALAQLIACIEATIPFRNGKNGLSIAEIQEGRMRRCNSKYELGLDENAILIAIGRAVSLANRDSKELGTEDCSEFLGGARERMREANPSLRSRSHSVRDMRAALEKELGNVRSLDAATVFRHHRGRPAPEHLTNMEDNARNNIRLYRSCLTVDFVTTVLLEALADTTGGDLPMAMLMGEIPPQGENTCEPRPWMKLGDFLPKVVGINGDIDPLTMFLLRRSESVLATFVYNGLGETGLRNLEEKSYEFLAGRLLDKDFLAAFPEWILVPIARACARICLSRADELSRIAQEAIGSDETLAEFETLRAVV